MFAPVKQIYDLLGCFFYRKIEEGIRTRLIHGGEFRDGPSCDARVRNFPEENNVRNKEILIKIFSLRTSDGNLARPTIRKQRHTNGQVPQAGE